MAQGGGQQGMAPPMGGMGMMPPMPPGLQQILGMLGGGQGMGMPQPMAQGTPTTAGGKGGGGPQQPQQDPMAMFRALMGK